MRSQTTPLQCHFLWATTLFSCAVTGRPSLGRRRYRQEAGRHEESRRKDEEQDQIKVGLRVFRSDKVHTGKFNHHRTSSFLQTQVGDDGLSRAAVFVWSSDEEGCWQSPSTQNIRFPLSFIFFSVFFFHWPANSAMLGVPCNHFLQFQLNN